MCVILAGSLICRTNPVPQLISTIHCAADLVAAATFDGARPAMDYHRHRLDVFDTQRLRPRLAPDVAGGSSTQSSAPFVATRCMQTAWSCSPTLPQSLSLGLCVCCRGELAAFENGHSRARHFGGVLIHSIQCALCTRYPALATEHIGCVHMAQ